MNLLSQTTDMVAKASLRISEYIHNTPLLFSESLNTMLGSNVYFKMDALQKTGSFKLRGTLNHLLALRETGSMPARIVGYSTGNHALAMAYAARLFNIHARVYLPSNVSPIKKRITEYYGAEVIEVSARAEAEERAKTDGDNEFYFLHPSEAEETIAGAGTMCYEALMEMKERKLPSPEAIFAACGGGGLLAGTYLAKELLSPSTKVIGAEPELANDAYISIKQGTISRFQDSPNTVADGLRTLALSERTFNYLKKLDGIYLCSEDLIYYWTAWLMQTLKITCEPSAAISMAAAHSWLKLQPAKKPGERTILVLISGGNIDPALYLKLWNDDHLKKLPE